MAYGGLRNSPVLPSGACESATPIKNMQQGGTQMESISNAPSCALVGFKGWPVAMAYGALWGQPAAIRPIQNCKTVLLPPHLFGLVWTPTRAMKGLEFEVKTNYFEVNLCYKLINTVALAIGSITVALTWTACNEVKATEQVCFRMEL